MEDVACRDSYRPLTLANVAPAWFMVKNPSKLVGSRMKRAFLVEDEGVVALLIESMLHDLGYDVLGPVPRLAKALDIARAETFDIGVLDVNLNGTPSFPVADLLLEKGIPFVFATGYGAPGIPSYLSTSTVLQKPFKIDQLANAINAAGAAVTRGPS
jgi:CheY-like chemotaxis protein